MLPEHLIAAKNIARERLLGVPLAGAASLEREGFAAGRNILGVGIGSKFTMGMVLAGQSAIRVYVRIKMPERELPRRERVPPQIEGVPTDVIEVGDVKANQAIKTWQRFSRNRPAWGGVSIGHPQVTAGTLGCLVEDEQGERFILGNNHILADENNAHLNDPILQPAVADGGCLPGDEIARLAAFKPLDFSGGANDIDAAIARVNPKMVDPNIVDIGRPNTSARPAVQYLSVRKHGRSTGHTVGIVEDTSADIWIQYRDNKRAWFEEQIVVRGVGNRDFARSGDSGALVVDAVTAQPVGLLFAVGNELVYINPVDLVLSYFGMRIVG